MTHWQSNHNVRWSPTIMTNPFNKSNLISLEFWLKKITWTIAKTFILSLSVCILNGEGSFVSILVTGAKISLTNRGFEASFVLLFRWISGFQGGRRAGERTCMFRESSESDSKRAVSYSCVAGGKGFWKFRSCNLMANSTHRITHREFQRCSSAQKKKMNSLVWRIQRGQFVNL